jgi:hypothetical protein
MLILHYKTKKELKAAVGSELRFTETSFFGQDYRENGIVYGTNHPKRSWFAKVELREGKIAKVS